MKIQIREGDLYRRIIIEDVQFEIRYGYACENERKLWEPSPLYPNFIQTPVYTKEGIPFVAGFQDICTAYKPKENTSGEQWCKDCIYYKHAEDHIGLCECACRNKNKMSKNAFENKEREGECA